jgi:hypothetical protein
MPFSWIIQITLALLDIENGYADIKLSGKK